MKHIGQGFYVNRDARFYAFGVRVPFLLWRLLYGTPRYVNVGDVLARPKDASQSSSPGGH